VIQAIRRHIRTLLYNQLINPIMKRAVVFGAGGFVGSHLTTFLVQKGYWVRAITSRQNIESVANEVLIGDCKSYSFVEHAVTGDFDEVYQLAAEMGGITHVSDEKNDADIMSNSALININVLKALASVYCNKESKPTVLFSSSACVYTSFDGVCKCNEDDVYPANPALGYGWEKLFSEVLYKKFEIQYGLKVRIARLHSIIGDCSRWNDGREKAHSALARKVACVEPGGTIDVIGDGTQVRTFLYISDCIEGISALMASDVTEPVNIGSPLQVSINEYLEVLKNISGKDFRINYIDGPKGSQERPCPIEKAKALLGWEPKVTLEEATLKTYTWILDKLASSK
jgi:GDP-D-mannose 3',5'-epimerase